MGCRCKSNTVKKIKPRVKPNNKTRPEHKTQY